MSEVIGESAGVEQIIEEVVGAQAKQDNIVLDKIAKVLEEIDLLKTELIVARVAAKHATAKLKERQEELHRLIRASRETYPLFDQQPTEEASATEKEQCRCDATSYALSPETSFVPKKL
jgi:hypothetical protein